MHRNDRLRLKLLKQSFFRRLLFPANGYKQWFGRGDVPGRALPRSGFLSDHIEECLAMAEPLRVDLAEQYRIVTGLALHRRSREFR